MWFNQNKTEGRVADNEQNRKMCLCPKCPSFPRDCSGEILYCAVGKSACDIGARGCVCGGCPVYHKYNLTKLYYCDKEKVGASGYLMRKKKSDEDPEFYHKVTAIKDAAQTGLIGVASMGSLKKLPYSFNDLHFIPAQVSIIPLNKEEAVNTSVVIGPAARQPLKLNSPIIISGMSFGATSKNVKLVISRVAAELGIGFNSGEGGILAEDYKAKAYLIGQYATGRFGVDENVLKAVAAVEIRFGQGAYPGKGSFLPAEKMTEEVARVRGLKGGEAAYSPAHHHDMATPGQIKEKIAWLKKITGGAPVGAKIGCGRIEQDIKILAEAGADFIAVDGFGAGTGATDLYVRENVGLPLIAALPRARKILEALGLKDKISLIAGGGLRSAADFAKCLALGADAVYIGTAALIAINCEQYRICQTGLCPTGVTTHSPELLKQLDVQAGARKLANFIKVATEEITAFARIAGKNDVNKLDNEDLAALYKDLATMTGLSWLDGKKY
ncbi:MAG: glutamate synthase-related protein [bacterium]|nr:glutamate synthase-related protein [bacterium]